MALTMIEKPISRSSRERWPAGIYREFEMEAQNPNGCLGQQLLSETDKVCVWQIHLKPRQRIGVHLHVPDYFWSVATNRTS